VLTGNNLQQRPRSQHQAVWLKRAKAFDWHLETAYLQQLPVRVIVVDGPKQGFPKKAGASSVLARLLDDASWAVTEFEAGTGRSLLVRGAVPVNPTALASPDPEQSWFEGTEKQRFVLHRLREGRARRAKIATVLAKTGGCLVCEVENCGFDFKKRYGNLGEGYAQVHHLRPLSQSPTKGRDVSLDELAIVCANCHAMIHLGGECRPLTGLISGSPR
jgi:5-methylcytosine-specific restriction enzyme A